MKTTGFLTPLRVEDHEDGVTWTLVEPLVFKGTQGDEFIVEVGEETDFASVPWWTQAVLPRTGTWTRAAVLHDLMCRLLNAYYRARLERWRSDPDVTWQQTAALFQAPAFSSVDADALFRKNARDGGTSWWRSELLWIGVRWGALANPARRSGWRSTAPRVLAGSAVVLGVLVATVALVARVVPW